MTKNLADELQLTARQAMATLAPVAQGDEPGGLPFRRLVAAVFRARYLVFATTLFGMLIGAFLALTTPNSYVSEGKFALAASGAESIGVDPTRATDTSAETIATTATYILNSQDLLMRVVDRVTPARILEPYQPGTGADSGAKGIFYRIQRDWNATKDLEATPQEALKRLMRTIVIDRPRSANVLVATCNANNPLLAQEILNVFMQEAVQWHIKQYENVGAYEEAKKRAEETQLALETARKAMRDFLERKAHVTAFDIEKERLQKALGDAVNKEAQLRSDAEGKRESLARLSKQLDEGAIKKELPQKRRADTTSGVQRNLEEALGRALVDLEGLRQVVANPERDRDFRAKEAEISSYRAALQKLREDARLAPEEEFLVANPDWVEANRMRTQLALETPIAVGQLAFAEKLVEEARRELRELVDLEPEFAKLRDSQAAAEDSARAAQVTWTAAQEKRTLAQGRFSALRDIQGATLPLDKEGPNRSKLLLGAFFGGLFFGLALVILRALPDNVIRTRDDLEKVEGIPVLGVMPRLDGGNLRRHVSLREQGW
ncbi:MAG: hypothetical protein JNK78_10770 [Planctomycetes bacterium]|nr:hypothetical protein [Planctomycetota bacterium]